MDEAPELYGTCKVTYDEMERTIKWFEHAGWIAVSEAERMRRLLRIQQGQVPPSGWVIWTPTKEKLRK